MASRIDWKKWPQHWPAEVAANADLLAGVLLSSPAMGDRLTEPDIAHVAGRHQGTVGWRGQLLAAQEMQRRPMLAARVEERVRTVLSLGGRQTIDSARPLQEYGLDSLLSIELRNALSTDLGVKLSATTLFDYPTLGGLTDWLFDDVLKLRDQDEASDGAVHPSASGDRQDVLAGVAALSDDEVERLFQEKMAGQAK
jgi:acyl carrier protein